MHRTMRRISRGNGALVVSSLVSSAYVRLRSLVSDRMQHCRSRTLTGFGELLSQLLKIGRSAVYHCQVSISYWRRVLSVNTAEKRFTMAEAAPDVAPHVRHKRVSNGQLGSFLPRLAAGQSRNHGGI